MNYAHQSLKGTLLLSLLILAVGVLPACGKKSLRTEIKQQDDMVTASDSGATEETTEAAAESDTKAENSVYAESSASTEASASTEGTSSAADVASVAAAESYTEQTTSTDDPTDAASLAPDAVAAAVGKTPKAPEPPVAGVIEKVPAAESPKAAAPAKSESTPVAAAATGDDAPPADMVAETSPVESTPVEAAQKKGGFPWLWILLLILLGIVAWYYWKSKKNTRPALLQPHPPLGGLSPVSGFTGRRRK